MKSRKCFEFTGEEAFFDGHFPGAPVLPGVVQLKLAVEAVEEMLGHAVTVRQVKRMKFVKVIEPNTGFEVEVEGDERSVVYRFLKEGEICSSGVLEF